MGSHSVTCHPTQVNVPHLTPAMQAGTRFAYPGGMEGWVDLVDLIAPRPGVEPATFRSRVRRRTAAPLRQPLWVQHRGYAAALKVMHKVFSRLRCTQLEWHSSGSGGVTAISTVLPRYKFYGITAVLGSKYAGIPWEWGPSLPYYRTTYAVMGLRLRELWTVKLRTDAWTGDCAFARFSRLKFHLNFYLQNNVS